MPITSGSAANKVDNKTIPKMEMTWTIFRVHRGGERCNCSFFEIDSEMDAILLIIGIVYRVFRIVIKSVQQCTYFLFSVNLFSSALITDKEPCKFAVNKRQNTNYSFVPVSSKVSCIRRKRGQSICLQENNKSMVMFFLKRRKVVR